MLTLPISWPKAPKPKRIWLALSGGLDSTVLLAVLHRWLQDDGGPSLGIMHVNYGLRGAESDRDEAFVRSLSETWQCPMLCYRVKDAGVTPPEAGIQDWARTIRYDFFRQHAAADEWVALAHHQDDLIETFLSRMFGGKGLPHVLGMSPFYENYWRPLLPFSRAELEHYARLHGLGHVEDSSNAEVYYTRNRLRLEILPALETMYPGLRENLRFFMDDIRTSLAWIQGQSPELLPQGLVNREALLAWPPAFAREALLRVIMKEDPNLRLQRQVLSDLYEALLHERDWKQELRPGFHAICHKGILRLEIDKFPESQRWLQYKEALSALELDLWP